VSVTIVATGFPGSKFEDVEKGISIPKPNVAEAKTERFKFSDIVAGKSSVISGFAEQPKTVERTTSYSSLLNEDLDNNEPQNEDIVKPQITTKPQEKIEDLSDSRIDIDESDLPPFLRKKFYND